MLGEKLSGRYEILAELGRGGMGVVYRARDPLLNRDVAVKVIEPSMLTPETEQRFQTEAQVVAQMDHPSIVSIYDFGRHQGSLFFVMPIVVGESLRALLRKGTLTLGMVVDTGIAVAEALDYSHARGVIHRDIKPENIMVSVDSGNAVWVRVMDFGLARGTNVSSLTLTRTGMIMGTMWYISPEQVTGRTVDGRSDIYSLGIVLYECVANEVPFTGEMQSLLYRIVHELPQSPRSLGCKIDEELDEIILSCLSKEPNDRPRKAGDLGTSLRRYRTHMRDSQQMVSVLATGSVLAPRPALAPFVGREVEFRELQQRLNSAIRGECQFVLVSGDPGIGKTRLVDELSVLAGARQIRALHGRFVEQRGAFPYHGFCEAIQEFFRQKELGSPSTAPPDLSDLAADLIALFPMLSEISAIRNAASGGSTIRATSESRTAENRTQIFELLARTLIRLAGGRPLVLVFEELHGAEVSVEALQYIVRRLGPTPTLIVGTYRSTEIDRRHPIIQMLESFQGDRLFSLISLESLSPSDHRAFLSTLTGGSGIAPELAQKLFEATEGNPFFTKELVRSLLDSGSLGQDKSGAWSLSDGVDISSELLPATIQQAVEARIGRLPDALRDILSVASVMGKTFDFQDLEALHEGEGDLDQAADRLIQEGLLEEDRQSRGDRLSFASAVVREVLYAGLSRRKRRTLHRRFAERLEKRQAGRLERVYPQLLYHFYEADDPEKSVEYGLLHARKSLESFSPEEVVRASKIVLEFLDEDWEGERSLEGEARLLLASGHRMAGDMASALKETAAAVRILERERKPGQAVKAILAAAKTAWQVRQTEETRQWVERGLEAARAAGESESLAQLLSLAATLANLRGEYSKATDYLKESERLLEGVKKAVTKDEIPRGGRLVVGLANPIAAMSPVGMQLTEEFEVYSNVYETLLATDEEGNPHPALCKTWSAREEGKAFQFALRPDVRFHDGQILSAEEVKESFERAIRQAASDLPAGFSAIRGARAYAGGHTEEVSGLVVRTGDTIEIGLEAELPIYPILLTDPRTAVARPSSLGPGSEIPLAGTGPFRLVSHERERLVLERNAGYWKGTPPNVESVEFRTGLSASALASAFRSGELDVTRDLLPQDLEETLRDTRFHDSIIEAPQKFTYFLLFNTHTGPATQNPTVRHALSRSVRSRDLVWRTLGRFAEPAVCLVPPGILGHDPGRRIPTVPPDEARTMLRSAGLPETIQLKAAVHPLFQDRYRALLDALFRTWSELGIDVSIVTSGTESYLKSWHTNEGIDLMITRWKPDVDDPDACTYSLFHSGSGLMRAYFSSSEADQILEAARTEGRPGVRESLYRKFENMLLDASVITPLFHDIGYRLVSAKVKGIRLRSIQPCVNYAELGKMEAGRVMIEQRRAGGIVRAPMSGRVKSLDPMVAVLIEEAEALSSIFESLTRDVGEARIEPWLVSELRVEDGGKRYRFRLRNDVTFHDGRRLSARDVRYSFERLLQHKQSESRWLFAPIRGARALLEGGAGDLQGFRIHSASEFSMELEQPLSFFPVLLSALAASIVPEGTGHIGDSLRDGAIGTGPFRVVRFEPGTVLELERNPAYWRKGFPKCDHLVFHFGMAPVNILSEFRAGRVSLAADLYPEDVEALRRDATHAAGYMERPRLSVYFVAFNVHRGPLQDKALRRKLVQAVDPARLVKQTLGTLAVPAQGLIPPGLLGHDPLRAVGVVSRPAACEAEAPEIELTAAMHPVFAGEYSSVWHEIMESFQAAGVRVRVTSETINGFREARLHGTADILVARWIADYPDADTFAYLIHSHDGILGRVCGVPETDRLIALGRSESDPQARHSIYGQIEEIISREALLLPLFHEQVYRFARSDLHGLGLSYWLPTVAYENLSVRGD